MDKLTVKRPIVVYKDAAATEKDDIVREFPLTIFINHKEILTIVCSPDHLAELGVGFLLSEGIVQNLSDIHAIELQEDEGFLNFVLDETAALPSGFLRRNIASCCGKGRAGLYFISDAKQVRAVPSDVQFRSEHILRAITLLEERSDVFRCTGGVHNAALSDINIENEPLVLMFEDIGRHNTIDKLIGAAFLRSVDVKEKYLVFSGRITSEIVIKAARANISLIVSKAAPTDLAVELAEELNLATIGFARKDRFNIYSHPEKIRIR
ncbi:formate dehydrogenase accessory sulfurtransferase FdhD [Dehalobacter sp. DCM]|uniref:formate dehydrogenase accessory sulfurtransferase FdhD n=1 Tax=Dehalobacter sp. DCM TaxID=2907827 RepID=UPI00308211A1|nr:formate dehydrogenase accessory sulfurtransferase FdhD [Dehalobacter sp. DCM]